MTQKPAEELFRGEALANLGDPTPPKAVLQAVPAWVHWAFWLMVAVVVAGVAVSHTYLPAFMPGVHQRMGGDS